MISALNRDTKTIHNAVIITVNEQFDIIENGFITIVDGVIAEVGEGNPKQSENMIDAKGKIIMPGFINAHTHLPMTMFRGIADDLPLQEWLEEHIWPAEAEKVNVHTVRKAVKTGLQEMSQTGTTTFADMYFFADIVAEETEKFGLRGVMNEAILDFKTSSYNNTEEVFKKNIDFINRWRDNSLIIPAVSFHSVYTCSIETIAKVNSLVKEYNLHVFTHLAENKKEIGICRDMYGFTPVGHLSNCGILSKKLSAVHCVEFDKSDIDIFSKSKASVVHCPTSNLKLGSGVAPVAEYVAKGINVALGTDGPASNNNLDMVEEMRFAALLQKGFNNNPTLIPAREAIKMATINGANALGIESVTGSVEEGKSADLLIIDTDNTFMTPIYDYCSAVVYSMNSSCIETTIVAGKVVYSR